jgi:hypothetical protein
MDPEGGQGPRWTVEPVEINTLCTVKSCCSLSCGSSLYNSFMQLLILQFLPSSCFLTSFKTPFSTTAHDRWLETWNVFTEYVYSVRWLSACHCTLKQEFADASSSLCPATSNLTMYKLSVLSCLSFGCRTALHTHRKPKKNVHICRGWTLRS